MKRAQLLLSAFLLLISFCIPASAEGYTIVCEPQYNMAESFEQKVTKVSKNSKWALANTNGTPITDFAWDALGDVISEYIPAKNGDRWGYVSSDGKLLVPYSFLSVGNFSDGIAMAQTENGAHVYINTNGDILFTSPFTYSFSVSGGAICGALKGCYGYCDTDGNIIIAPQFDMAYDFHEGYAAVKFGGKWGYITSYGNYHVTPTYDYASDFKNGYAICRIGSSYGIINSAGKRTSSFDFDYLGLPDDSGRFPAKSGTVSGFVDANGKWLIKTEYDYCYGYTDGVARVYKNGLWGYIDENGNELIAPTFVDCGKFLKGVAPYSTDGYLWGYLSLNKITTDKVSSTEVSPVNPATDVPKTTPPSDNISDQTEDEQSSVTIQNPASSDSLRPLDVKGENCISMKIGSNIALCGSSERKLSVAPVLLDGTTMIPVRDMIELLGGGLAWNATAQRITLSYNYKIIYMTVGSKIAFSEGSPIDLPHAPVLSNGTTLVPLRTIIDEFKCTLEWINDEQNIYIYY